MRWRERCGCIGSGGMGPSRDRYHQILKIVVGSMSRSWRCRSNEIFRGYFISGRNGKASASSNQLMFCPIFSIIIETPPKRCDPSFDLPVSVTVSNCSRHQIKFLHAYHELSYDSFTEVFCACIDAHRYQVSAIDMFLLYALLSLLHSSNSLLLQLPGLPFLLRFPPFRYIVVGVRPKSKEGQIRPTASSRARSVQIGVMSISWRCWTTRS